MFAVGPILLEIIFVLLKPQELLPWLTGIQPLYTIPGLIMLGFVFDAGRYGLGAGRMIEAPALRWALGLYAWAMLTVIIYAPAKMTGEAILFGTSLLMSVALSQGIQSLDLYKFVGGTMLSLTLLLGFIGTHQALAPFRCYWIDPVDRTILHYEGGECENMRPDQCGREGDDRSYVCEHAGLMGTSSVSGRIRFRGNLEDPNELALTVGVGLPFAFAFFQAKKSFFRILLLAGALGLVVSCIFYSQSRGGQLVLLVVLGTYFMRRFGWKWGLVCGALAAVPLAVLASMSGRSSEEAEGSSLERIECLAVGLELVRHSPIFGVGKGQFMEYHFLTAHNSYVLAAAELGMVGFAIWSFVMYLSVKVPLAALRALDTAKTPEADAIRPWALAALASMCGAVVGSFFLSFSFHAILWIYIGLAGSIAAVVKRAIPDFRVTIRPKEMGLIVLANVVLLVTIFVYARHKLG